MKTDMKVSTLIRNILRETGEMLTSSKIYHWEKYGMVKGVGSTPTDRRAYSDEHYEAVLFIMTLKAFGLTIREIKQYLAGDINLLPFMEETAKQYEHNKLPRFKKMIELLKEKSEL